MFASLTLIYPVMACSCGSREPVLACEIYHQTPVVFRGWVIDGNRDYRHDVLDWRLFRVRVEEIFRGLPLGTRELFVDPGTFTPCPSEFQVGSDYVFYANVSTPIAPTFTSFLEEMKKIRLPGVGVRPVPVAWKSLGHLPVVLDGGMCGPTRTIGPNDPDLRYLREAAQGKVPAGGVIRGIVAQNWDDDYRIRSFVPVRDALVRATTGATTLSTYTNGNGEYQFDNLRPGEYQLTATEDHVRWAQFPARDPLAYEVPRVGCVVANASLATSATISGIVLDSAGNPAPGVELDLGRILTNRTTQVVPGTSAKTDEKGRFTIRRVPVGRVVVGVNISASPRARQPFETTYAPGTSTVGAAQIYSLQPHEQLSDVTLRLPVALPFAQLEVVVRWPDGTPATSGARAFAELDGRRSGQGSATPDSNRVKLSLALGKIYDISGEWSFISRDDFDWVDGQEKKQIHFTHDGQQVTIYLKPRRPPGKY